MQLIFVLVQPIEGMKNSHELCEATPTNTELVKLTNPVKSEYFTSVDMGSYKLHVEKKSVVLYI